MTTLTERKYTGDLIKVEFHPAHNRAKNKLQAAVSVAVNSEILGYPIINTPGTSAIIQTAAQVTAFTATSSCGVVTDDSLANEAFSATPSTSQYGIGLRGPMVVGRDALRTTDPAAAAYDMAKFIAALNVAGITVVDSTGQSVTS